MSVFTSAPFSLTYNTLIAVTVAAVNVVNTGTTSSYNSAGAYAATVPTAPTTLAEGTTTATSI